MALVHSNIEGRTVAKWGQVRTFPPLYEPGGGLFPPRGGL